MASRRLPLAFGVVLRKCRIQKGLSQEQLGHRAGTNQAYVSLLEKGMRSPSLVTLDLLAAALGMKFSVFAKLIETEATRW